MFTKRQIGKGIPTMGRVQIFTGDGYGKTMAALGEALIAAASGKKHCHNYTCQYKYYFFIYHIM